MGRCKAVLQLNSYVQNQSDSSSEEQPPTTTKPKQRGPRIAQRLSSPDSRYKTIEEVAILMRVSAQVVQMLIKRKMLPSFKVGQQIRIDWLEAEQAMKEGRCAFESGPKKPTV
jgi:excisionase family DNA binding protein